MIKKPKKKHVNRKTRKTIKKTFFSGKLQRILRVNINILVVLYRRKVS